MIIQEPVQAAIWQCLNHFAYSDAQFLAERLYAEVQTEESVLLLATCLYRAGSVSEAYSLLCRRQLRLPGARYLLALCCWHLDRLADAEHAVTGGVARHDDDVCGEFGELAAFVYRLLARIYARTERKSKAADACRRALKLNPFLFHSFIDLCQLSEPTADLQPDSHKTFTAAAFVEHLSTASRAAATSHIHHHHPHLQQHLNPQQQQMSAAATSNKLSTTSARHHQHIQTPQSMVAMCCTSTPIQTASAVTPAMAVGGVGVMCCDTAETARSGAISPFTPSFGCVTLETPSCAESSCISGVLPLTTLSSPALTNHVDNQPAKQQHQQQQQQQRRPFLRRERVFSSLSGNSVKENNKSSSRFVTPRSPSRKIKTRSSKTASSSLVVPPSLHETNENRVVGGERVQSRSCGPTAAAGVSLSSEGRRGPACTGPAARQQLVTSADVVAVQTQSVEGLMSLLRCLGAAYLHMARYECARVIELLCSLPSHQYHTAWVLSLVGMAHFEMNNYKQAAEMFESVRVSEPYRVDMMEYYSTTLWHLQKDVQLSALAQDMLDHARDSPQAWCAAGNCFSLQKEHETAIKFFKRAVQLRPRFAYAHTLLGHEYVLIDDLSQALDCFRKAVAVEPNLYNAWYGIGMIYYKQERFQMAEVYFKNAVDINPRNSVLLCHVGVVQHSLGRSQEALRTLNRAAVLNAANPLCLFHRASINVAVGRLDDALRELKLLRRLVPRESLVYFLTGKVYEAMGEQHLARMHFSWAMDLDPKGANNQLKEAIEPMVTASSLSIGDKAEESLAILGSFLSSDLSLLMTSSVGGGAAGPGGSMDTPTASSSAVGASNVDSLQLQAMDSDESF